MGLMTVNKKLFFFISFVFVYFMDEIQLSNFNRSKHVCEPVYMCILVYFDIYEYF